MYNKFKTYTQTEYVKNKINEYTYTKYITLII